MEMQIIEGLIYVMGELAPVIIPEIQEAIARGDDIKSIDWKAKYGRSIAELRAEVDSKKAGGA